MIPLTAIAVAALTAPAQADPLCQTVSVENMPPPVCIPLYDDDVSCVDAGATVVVTVYVEVCVPQSFGVGQPNTAR